MRDLLVRALFVKVCAEHSVLAFCLDLYGEVSSQLVHHLVGDLSIEPVLGAVGVVSLDTLEAQISPILWGGLSALDTSS